jgi:hypothetical protein
VRWAAVFLAAAIFRLAAPFAAGAAVYYVDSAGGSDGNPGISQSAAWQNIPGACPSGAQAPAGAGWTKIKAGDSIVLKAGSTFYAKVVIDGQWYESGTKDAPIAITCDPSWGSGAVTIDCSGQAVGRHDAALSVVGIDYVQIDGGSPAGIVVQGSSAAGFRAAGVSEGQKAAGLVVRNARLYGNGGPGVVLRSQDAFLLEDVEADGGGGPAGAGFSIGGQSNGCSNGTVRGCVAYGYGAKGPDSASPGGGAGFGCTDSTGVTYERCIAHDNGGRGFDARSAGWPISTVTDRIIYLDCVAYGNGEGFRCSLDDVPGDARFWYLNCISRNNGSGWTVCKGPTAYLYNCVSAKNANGLYLDTLAFSRQTVVTMKNTIIYDSAAYAVWAHDCRSIRYYADYNLYDAGSGGGTLVRWYDAPDGDKRFKEYAFDGRPGMADWQDDCGRDAHSRDSGNGKFAAFADPDKDDYSLLPTSDARGAGADLTGEWPAGVPSTDMRGRPRQTGAWDIGAIEYAEGTGG